MAKATGLGEIFYVVESPERTRAWYRDVLGIDGQYDPTRTGLVRHSRNHFR